MHRRRCRLRTSTHKPLGRIVRRLLAHRIRTRWRGSQGATLIGLGFATPYLGSFRGEARRSGAALMPTHQGALVWPRVSDRELSVLVEEVLLPLPDNSVDRLLCVHCLEVRPSRGAPAARNVAGSWRPGAARSDRAKPAGACGRGSTDAVRSGPPLQPQPAREAAGESMFTPVDWSAPSSCRR